MAITIQQDPTSPNIVNSDLLYVCTSTKTSEAQMQFVCDVKDDLNNLVQRIKQQPSPNNNAVFNLGQIMTGYFEGQDNTWEITLATRQTNTAEQYKVFFGEEYASSVSSSVELYDGIQNATTGSPELSGSNYYLMLNGQLNELQLTNWNWNSGSKLDYETPSANNTFTHQNGLTAFDTSSITETDYHTIAFLNGNVIGEIQDVSNAQDVYVMEVSFYEEDGTLIRTDEYYNLNPRTGNSDLWSDVYTTQDQYTKLIYFPAGPQNFDDAAQTIPTASAYYDCVFKGQNASRGINDNAIWGQYRFNIQECSGFTPQRFAWKNQWGVWDYFNFTKANNRSASVQRKEYTQTFVDYSPNSFPVSYDKTRRGRVNHYNEVTKQRVANTDWLTQTEADNLRELFFSANVYYYDLNNGWVPIVVTTANITERTNDLSQKVFQYEMAYEYAVGQRPRQ